MNAKLLPLLLPFCLLACAGPTDDQDDQGVAGSKVTSESKDGFDLTGPKAVAILGNPASAGTPALREIVASAEFQAAAKQGLANLKGKPASNDSESTATFVACMGAEVDAVTPEYEPVKEALAECWFPAATADAQWVVRGSKTLPSGEVTVFASDRRGLTPF